MACFKAASALLLLLLLAAITCSATARHHLDEVSANSASSDGAGSPIVASSTPSVVNPIPAVTTTTGFAVYGSRSGTGTATYWSNNLERVPPSISLVWTLVKVFGARVLKFFGNALTLLGAIRNPSSEPFAALAREASVSLLNSYTSPNFPLSPDQVLSLFNDAFASSDELITSIQDATLQFKLYNEAV